MERLVHNSTGFSSRNRGSKPTRDKLNNIIRKRCSSRMGMHNRRWRWIRMRRKRCGVVVMGIMSIKDGWIIGEDVD